MLAGWAAVLAAILTVTGLMTLLAFFKTGSSVLGALNDISSALLAAATFPVALALYSVTSRTSGPIATAAIAADVVGATLVVVSSGLLVTRIMSFEATLTPNTVGNGLIGVWVVLTAALLVFSPAVPPGVPWLGLAGGVGLVVASVGFPLLGRDHPIIAAAGLLAVIGLVGFYVWLGVLILQGRLPTPS